MVVSSIKKLTGRVLTNSGFKVVQLPQVQRTLGKTQRIDDSYEPAEPGPYIREELHLKGRISRDKQYALAKKQALHVWSK